MLTVFWSGLYNSLPKYLRDIEIVKTDKFKFQLDKIFELIPDKPKMPNYVTGARSNDIHGQLSQCSSWGIYQGGGVPDPFKLWNSVGYHFRYMEDCGFHFTLILFHLVIIIIVINVSRLLYRALQTYKYFTTIHLMTEKFHKFIYAVVHCLITMCTKLRVQNKTLIKLIKVTYW